MIYNIIFYAFLSQSWQQPRVRLAEFTSTSPAPSLTNWILWYWANRSSVGLVTIIKTVTAHEFAFNHWSAVATGHGSCWFGICWQSSCSSWLPLNATKKTRRGWVWVLALGSRNGFEEGADVAAGWFALTTHSGYIDFEISASARTTAAICELQGNPFQLLGLYPSKSYTCWGSRQTSGGR